MAVNSGLVNNFFVRKKIVSGQLFEARPFITTCVTGDTAAGANNRAIHMMPIKTDVILNEIKVCTIVGGTAQTNATTLAVNLVAVVDGNITNTEIIALGTLSPTNEQWAARFVADHNVLLGGLRLLSIASIAETAGVPLKDKYCCLKITPNVDWVAGVKLVTTVVGTLPSVSGARNYDAN